MTFKAYVHYLRHRFINQKTKCKDGGSYFYKNQKYRPLEIGGKIFFFQLFHFRNSYIFKNAFFRKYSMFRRIIPLTFCS